VVALELDARLAVSLVRGNESSFLGWVSRGYHRRTPSTTVIGRCAADGPVALLTRIAVRAAEREEAPEEALEGADSTYCTARSGVEVA
jgi:hypothetical protein